MVSSFDRQKTRANLYHKVSGGSYEYFEGMGLPELDHEVKKVDDAVQFQRFARKRHLADLAMDFASILSKEYADAMMKAGTPEKLDLNPIGTGPFQLRSTRKIPVFAIKRLMATGAPNRRSIRWSSLLPLTLHASREIAEERMPGDAVPEPGRYRPHEAG